MVEWNWNWGGKNWVVDRRHGNGWDRVTLERVEWRLVRDEMRWNRARLVGL